MLRKVLIICIMVFIGKQSIPIQQAQFPRHSVLDQTLR
jgi:hypothetical protein